MSQVEDLAKAQTLILSVSLSLSLSLSTKQWLAHCQIRILEYLWKHKLEIQNCSKERSMSAIERVSKPVNSRL